MNMPGTVPGPAATTIKKTQSLKETFMGEEVSHNTFINNIF